MSARPAPIPIRLQQCAKTFGDGTRALWPLDLDVAPGETLVLLGPSGCGKTTTLRMIAGLERPDAGGSIHFGDDDVTALPIEKRGVGMVFQNYALFPNMRVRENIAYGLKVRGVAREEQLRRVDELAQMMQLDQLLLRRIDQLSGGQRQRVALARAIAIEPRVLLLDEPLTALDAKLRDALRIDIDRLLRRLSITTIYVTHDQSEAMALGDRVVVMQAGKIAQIGTPREIYHRPKSAFVADFIGVMNRLPATRAGAFLEVPGGRVPFDGAEVDFDEIMFRPHDVDVDLDAPQLRGTIVATVFLGDRLRVVVETGAPRQILVDTRVEDSLRVGDKIGLSIRPQGWQAFPRESQIPGQSS